MPAQPAAAIAIEDIDRGEDPMRLGVNAGFFEQFADRRILDRLSGVDLSARETSSSGIGRIGSPHQEYAAVEKHRGDGRCDRPERRLGGM